MESRRKKKSVLLWLTKVAGRTQLYIFLLVLIEVICGGCSVYQAMQMRLVVNAAAEGRQQAFVVAALGFAALLAVQILFSGLYTRLGEHAVSNMENNMKKRLFDCLLRKDYASVTAVHSGEWMNRLTNDTVVVANGLTQIIPSLVGTMVRLVGALAAMLWLEPRFLYLVVPGGILMILISYLCRKIMKRLHRQIQESDGYLRAFLQERLGSMLIVRSFAREQDTLHQAEDKMKDHQAARMKRNGFAILCNMGYSGVMCGAYLLGAVWCGYGLLKGTMSFGNLTAILTLINQVQNPFASLSGFIPRYYASIASAERLMEAEYFGDDCTESEQEQAVQKFYSDEFKCLGMKDACFTYQPPVRVGEGTIPMPVVLSNLNLEVQKGQYVAFTGPSGCGKSTVLKLLMCLYPLDSGVRYMQGGDREWPLSARWRRLFAYVPQGNQLLSGSVREIVAFGDREKMSQTEALWDALKIACADEFVRALDSGLDTQLGERGAGLSEGQTQRIAIARAVFSGHPILLLDEATSALDEETEAQLLQNLRSMTDKTVLIVTHRPAALEIVDKVIDFETKGADVQ